MTPSPNLVPGARVADRFDLVDALGADGLGAAFHAVDTAEGGEVVLRVFPAGALPAAERALLRAEIEGAAVVRHPNLAPLLAFGSDDAAGVDWVAEARARGETLATLLAARGTPPRPLALRLLHEAVAGVAAAHREGTVHGDLHPGNVFLARVEAERRVRVQVTGLGQRRGRAVPRTGMPSAPRYASPERLRREAVLTPAADVFALGVMAYELLAGLPPQWNQALMAMARGQEAALPSPVEVRPDLPPALAEVVLGALEADPLRRFLDADDFGAALARAAAEEVPTAPAPEAVPQPRAPSSVIAPAIKPAPVVAPGVAMPVVESPPLAVPAAAPVAESQPLAVPAVDVPPVVVPPAPPAAPVPTAAPSPMPHATPRKVPAVAAVVAADLGDALYIPPTMGARRESPPVAAPAAPTSSAVAPSTVVPATAAPAVPAPTVAQQPVPVPSIPVVAQAATVEPPSPVVERVVEEVPVASPIAAASMPAAVTASSDVPREEVTPPMPPVMATAVRRDEEPAPAPQKVGVPAVARPAEIGVAAPTTVPVPAARKPRIAPPSSNRNSPFLFVGGAMVALLVGGGIWASLPTPGEILLDPEVVAQKLAVSAAEAPSDAPAVDAAAAPASAAAEAPAPVVAPPAARTPEPAREQPQAQRPAPAAATPPPPAARTPVPTSPAAPTAAVQTPAAVAPAPAPPVPQAAQAAPRVSVERASAASAQPVAPAARPAANRVFRLDEVDRRPTLSNQPEVRRALARTPPPALAAGAAVEATVRFVVGVDGRIDLGTLTVMEATHGNVAGPASRVLARARSTPGQVNGRAVRTEVVMPISWQPE